MFKRRFLKRILPVLLSAAMVVQPLPMTALAAEYEQISETETQAPALENQDEAQAAENADKKQSPEDNGETQNKEAEKTEGENAQKETTAQETETFASETSADTGETKETTDETAVPAQTGEAKEETEKTEITQTENTESESEAVEETKKEDEKLQEGEQPETLLLDKEKTVSLTRRVPVWLEFTAQDTGEYIFMSTTYSSSYKIGLYNSMDDSASALEDKYPDFSYYTNGCSLNAGDKIYVKITAEYSDGQTSIYVQKAPSSADIKGTISAAAAKPISFASKIECTFTREQGNDEDLYSLTSGKFAVLYSDKQDADFGAVNGVIAGDFYSYNKIRGLIGVNMDYDWNNSSGDSASLYSNISGLKDATTYYYQIFAKMPLNGSSDSRRCWISCTDTQKFTTSAAPDTKKISVAMTLAEAGYGQFLVKAEVTNPDDVVIVDEGFDCKSGEEARYIRSEWDREDTGGYSKTKFSAAGYFEQKGESVTVTPYVEVQTGVDDVNGERILKKISGEPKTLTAKTTPGLSGNLFTVASAQTQCVRVAYDFDVQNKGDYSFDVYYTLKKQGETAAAKTGTAEIYVKADSTKFSGNFMIDSLEPDTTYSLTLNLKADIIYGDGTKYPVLYEQTIPDFKTKENATYTDKEIPDATLRKLIENALGSDKALTSANLEKITYLTISGDTLNRLGADSAIKNLTGIKYLENLTGITIYGQDITDISPIKELKNLENASFSSNMVEKIPDLSSMASLKKIELSANRIPASEFALTKLPQSMRTDKEALRSWNDAKKDQRNKEALHVADTYYIMNDGAALIYAEIDGMRYGREWKVKAVVDNAEHTMATKANYGYILPLKDLAEGTHKIKITAQEDYNGLKLEQAEKNVELKPLGQSIKQKKHINESTSSIYYQVYVQELNITPTEAYLTDPDKNNAKAAISSSKPYASQTYINYALPTERAFVHGWPYMDSYKCTSISGNLNFTYLPKKSGSYDLVIKTADKEYTFAGYATADYDSGVVTKVAYSSDYDNSRNYLYICVEGDGLVYDKMEPVIKLEDGTAVTEKISRIGNVYKLKKLDKFVKNENLPYEIKTSGDYKITYGDNVSRTIYTADGNEVIYLSYNAKIKKYVIHTSAEMPDNTQIELVMSEGSLNWNDNKWVPNWGTIRAHAAVTVNGASKEVNFLDDNGKQVWMPQNSTWYYGAQWTQGESDINHHTAQIRHTESGFCETPSSSSLSIGLNVTRSLKNVKEIPFTFYAANYDNILSKDDTVTISLTKDSKEVQAPITLALTEKNKSLEAEGKFTANENYPIGEYRISASCKGYSSGSYTVYIYGDDTFYQVYQGSSAQIYNGQSCAYLNFDAADLGLDESKFKVTFYDIEKNEITGVKQIGKEVNEKYGFYYYYYSGLVENYRAAYVKVTYNGKIGISIKDSTKSFYKAENDSEEWGRLSYFNQSISFKYDTGIGICRVISHVDNYSVDILDDDDGTLLATIDVKDKGTYDFKQSDLAKVTAKDSKLEKLYTLVARKGNVTYNTYRGCNIGYKGMAAQKPGDTPEPVKATDITLNRPTLTLGKGAAYELTASLTPADAVGTVTFEVSESNPQGAIEITQNGLKATITAKEFGKATVRATVTSGDTTKYAECIVEVKGIYSEQEKADAIKKAGNLYAVFETGETVTLEKVKFPENSGWSWADSTTRLVAFDSAPEFWAVYKQDKYEDLRVKLPVKVTEITNISITGADEITQGEGAQNYKAEVALKGYKEGVQKTYVWSAATDSKLMLPADKSTEAISVSAGAVTAPKTETLSVKVTVGGKEITKTKDIKINPAHIKDIKITAAAAEGVVARDDEIYLTSTVTTVQLNVSAKKSGADITVANGTFEWNSSDPNVAEVPEDANGNAVLTIKGVGFAHITATAAGDDPVHNSGSILVYVEEDFEPILETDKVSLSAYSKDGVAIPLHAKGVNAITGMTVDNAKFEVKEGMLKVSDGQETKVDTKETVKITVTTSDGISHEPYKLTVTVDNKPPKVTFKSVEKANTFYQDAKAVYAVSADVKIKGIKDNAGMAASAGYTVLAYDNGVLTLQHKKDSANKAANVIVELEGYKEFDQTITSVAAQTKKPSYAIEEIYLPNTATTGMAKIMSGKTEAKLDGVRATAIAPSPEGVSAQIKDGRLALTWPATLITGNTKNISYQVKLESDNWTDSNGITLKGKISIKELDQIVISQNKVTLNNAYLNAEPTTIDAYIKNSAEKLSGVKIDPVKNPTGITPNFDIASQKIVITCPAKAGTYKYTVYGIINGKQLRKPASLTVTVVDGQSDPNKKAAKLTLSAKGSINLVDRDGTSIIYTPKIANASGTVETVELGGKDCSLFTANAIDGKIELKAVKGEAMQTKTPYELTFKATLDNGIEVLAEKIKVKPVNKPPKAKADLSKATIYKISGTKISWNVSTGEYKIAGIELVPGKSDTNTEKFKLTPAVEKADGKDVENYAKPVLELADKTIKPGKYTLSYRVMLEDEATDAKPMILKMSVTVK